MHTLTRDEAKRAGYTGYAEHLTTVPCPRLKADSPERCANCGGMFPAHTVEARRPRPGEVLPSG
jgi:hypothetical protein